MKSDLSMYGRALFYSIFIMMALTLICFCVYSALQTWNPFDVNFDSLDQNYSGYVKMYALSILYVISLAIGLNESQKDENVKQGEK